MSIDYSVVVYGANGYTGKLIAEHLAKQGINFIAAGRNLEKLQQAMSDFPQGSKVKIVSVAHDEAELSRLFAECSVVVNVTGPFGQLGETVVRAALAAHCHYIDTTGEGDYAVNMRDRYGDQFKAKERVFISACAFMWAAGMIAAELALEDPKIHTLDILYAPRGNPTVASTLSFLRMCCLPQYYKEDGVLHQWPALTVSDVAVPGRHAIHLGLPWGGGFEPLWLEHHQQTLTCKVMVAFAKGPLTDFVVSKIHEYHELANTKTAGELEEITNNWGMAIAQTPPQEVREVNHNIISCYARGNTTAKHILLHTTCPYIQTGALVAESCRAILNNELKAVGFQPATKAFGHRALITALAEQGLHCVVE